MADHNEGVAPVSFEPSLPDITKCSPVRAYKLGRYMALVIPNPPTLAESQGIPFGAVDHIFAMPITPLAPPHFPVLFVTAEKTGAGLSEMLGHIPEFRPNDIYLCVFDSEGHQNLGAVPNLDNVDVFAAQALATARDRLGIKEQPEVLEQKAASGNSGCLAVIAFVAVPLILLTFL